MATEDNIKAFLNEPVPNPSGNAQQQAATAITANPAAKTQPATNAGATTKKTTVTASVAGTGNPASRAAQSTINVVNSSVGGVGESIQSWASNLPTPGGLGLLIIVLFVFMWAIVPVNTSGGSHYTRLQLLYYTLTGRTTLGGPAETPTSTTGASTTTTNTSTTVAASQANGVLPISSLSLFNLPDFTSGIDFSGL